MLGSKYQFENEEEKVVGEIVNVGQTELRANIVGEIADGNFTPGSSSKPSFARQYVPPVPSLK